MAFELPIMKIPGAEAAADLSAKQFYCVKKNATDLQFALCDTDGEVFDGVLQDKPNAAGAAAEIMSQGVTKVICGETITAGDSWGTDVNGKARKVEKTITGADVGDFVMGTVMVGAALNELATVMFGPTFMVEKQ